MSAPPTLLRRAAVPRALVRRPDTFGGAAQGDCLTGDLLLAPGAPPRMLAPGEEAPAATASDLAGRIVIPRLAEPHCHLDKCHTIARLGPVGGDLHTAIAAQDRDKLRWTPADVRARAGRGLAELWRAGCAAARTHVDWIDPDGRTPLAWEVIGELAQEWAGRLTLQRCALFQIDLLDRPAVREAIAGLAGQPGVVLGLFVFSQPDKRRMLRDAIALAARHGLPLDLHIDEGLGPGLDGLATLADLLVEMRPGLPVLCGHACSMANLEGEQLRRTIERVAESGASIVSLPVTNLYLQDRQAGSPQRRGLTRVRELAAAGVPVAIGSDNVADAFCPLGAHDPLAALHVAALAAQLDPPYGQWLPSVTTTARAAIGLPPLHVDQAQPDDLLICDAADTAGVVAGAARRPLTPSPTG